MKDRVLQLFFVTFSLSLLGCVPATKLQNEEKKLDGTGYISISADLREARDLTSKTIIVIDSGEEIFIVDNSDMVFYKVKYKEHTGYISKNYLTKTRMPKVTHSSSIYTPSTRTPNKTADCRTVQCSGTTKKGARCRNTTTNCSGRCHLH